MCCRMREGKCQDYLLVIFASFTHTVVILEPQRSNLAREEMQLESEYAQLLNGEISEVTFKSNC